MAPTPKLPSGNPSDPRGDRDRNKRISDLLYGSEDKYADEDDDKGPAAGTDRNKLGSPKFGSKPRVRATNRGSVILTAGASNARKLAVAKLNSRK